MPLDQTPDGADCWLARVQDFGPSELDRRAMPLTARSKGKGEFEVGIPLAGVTGDRSLECAMHLPDVVEAARDRTGVKVWLNRQRVQAARPVQVAERRLRML